MIKEILERIEAAVRASTMPDRWWQAEDVGTFLGYSSSHILENVVCRPDFPKALRLDGGRPRWPSNEVRDWSLAQREQKIGRPRRVA
jgi:predicted DNA-binding transcriptional regulator AlpA